MSLCWSKFSMAFLTYIGKTLTCLVNHKHFIKLKNYKFINIFRFCDDLLRLQHMSTKVWRFDMFLQILLPHCQTKYFTCFSICLFKLLSWIYYVQITT
jgi:hypothetical protein